MVLNPFRKSETEGDPGEGELSDKEMRKKISKAENEMDRARDTIDQHTARYKKFLKKGAESKNPGQRRVFAIRARFEKFKAKVQEIRRLKELKKLSQWTVAMESSKIEQMVDDIDGADDMAEAALKSSDEMQDMIDDLVADLQAELSEMDDIMNVADIDVSGVGIQATEEEALMDSIAENETDLEDIDIDVQAVSLEESAEVTAFELDGAEFAHND